MPTIAPSGRASDAEAADAPADDDPVANATSVAAAEEEQKNAEVLVLMFKHVVYQCMCPGHDDDVAHGRPRHRRRH